MNTIAMGVIVKDVLESRDKKLEELLSQCTIIRKFNIKSLKNVDLFLFQENHGSSVCGEAQGAFINFLATRFPILLVIEEQASEIFNDENKMIVQQTHRIFPRDNIDIIGWDKKGIYLEKWNEAFAMKELIKLLPSALLKMIKIFNDKNLKNPTCFAEITEQCEKTKDPELKNSMETVISLVNLREKLKNFIMENFCN